MQDVEAANGNSPSPDRDSGSLRLLSHRSSRGHADSPFSGFWQRMDEASQAGPPEFMSTHPSHGTRIQQLQNSDTAALSNVQDADMATVAINFSTEQAAYSAALKAGANIVQSSLLDFLNN